MPRRLIPELPMTHPHAFHGVRREMKQTVAGVMEGARAELQKIAKRFKLDLQA